MAISNKPIKLEQVQLISKDYNEKINKKVDAVEGKSLVDDTEITKLQSVKANAEPNTITGIQINSQDITPDPETKKVNITAENLAPDLKGFVQDSELTEQLGEYTKTENLADDPGIAGKYLDKETAQSTYAKRDDIPKVQIPTCTQEELEDKKATAVDGDRVVVTDEEYHIYIYIGETGTGEWKDTGTHVVLTEYQKTADADSKYVAKDGDKVLVDPATVTQVDTNKQSIESLQTKVDGLDGALKESDIQFAEDQEVLEQLQAGATAAQGEA